jgi:ubiquinone biosynthesis protein
MPELMSTIAAAFAGASTADRVQAVEAAVIAGGRTWRAGMGRWVSQVLPVDTLVPDAYQHWRPLVQDAMQFVFTRLSAPRLANKIVEQFELPADTPSEARLLRLISKMPGLQKLGQVLARNRRLAPALRNALAELENGMSDVTAEQIRNIIVEELGGRLDEYAAEIEPAIFSEASVSAVMRFTWKNPGRERERAVFKVLKPHVPSCFAEDMRLLQRLGEFLAAKDRGYGFAIRDVREMLTEVRLLLEHELDFVREQATLIEAHRAYRSTIGIRVPRLIRPLCTSRITAMSEESGVKVTDAFRHWPIRRTRIAEQLVEAILAVPLFSRADSAIFHADPHAGNLLYNEPNRELVVLDWALAERLSREARRQLMLLTLMMTLRNPEGVSEAIRALARRDEEGMISREVKRFFDQLPPDASPGALDAMRLLDEIALQGVRFPAALFLFRKIFFTLDGVLHDVADADFRVDTVIAREFLTRWIASCGFFYAPLHATDLVSVPWNALLYLGRKGQATLS